MLPGFGKQGCGGFRLLPEGFVIIIPAIPFTSVRLAKGRGGKKQNQKNGDPFHDQCLLYLEQTLLRLQMHLVSADLF
jgi:hypothetical protein